MKKMTLLNTTLSLLIATALLSFTSVASAAPKLLSPGTTKVGNAFYLNGKGFPKSSYVTIRIGKPQSDAMFVQRIKTNKFGNFRAMQRFQVMGKWVWVANSGKQKAYRTMNVKIGASVFTKPFAVTAGTPFRINGHGWHGVKWVRIQAKPSFAKKWRIVGNTKVNSKAGSYTFSVTNNNPVFNPRTRATMWDLRVCTNICRLGNVSTRMKMGSIRIGEP